MKKGSLFSVIALVGSVSSIATYFITTQSYTQNSNAQNSPNIASNAPVTIHYEGKTNSRDWFSEYEKNRPNISKYQYDQVKEGMSYKDVLGILKIEGTELRSSSSGRSYAWGKSPFFYLHISFGSD